MSEALLTTAEVARHLKVSVKTIENWRAAGRIPFLRITSRCIRYDLEAVLEAVRRP